MSCMGTKMSSCFLSHGWQAAASDSLLSLIVRTSSGSVLYLFTLPLPVNPPLKINSLSRDVSPGPLISVPVAPKSPIPKRRCCSY
jgi:hypothetical protein